jgi:hypothetical protein
MTEVSKTDAPRSISRKSVRTGFALGPDAELKKPGESPVLPSVTNAGPYTAQLLE